MEYRKHPLEELGQSQLEEISAGNGHPFTPRQEKNIGDQFRRKVEQEKMEHTRKGPRILIVAVAAALALALVGFTGIDRIQRLFSQQFGAGSNLGQYAEPVGGESSSQGIRMEVLTALHDGEYTYLFADLTDESGEDRLGDDLLVDRWSLDGDRDFSGGNARLHSYDEATKTATLFVQAFGGNPGNPAAFTLSSFSVGEVAFDGLLDRVNLEQLLEESGSAFVPRDASWGFSGGYGSEFVEMGMSEEDIREILGEESMRLDVPEYPGCYLSGIAYRDGLLHIQANPVNAGDHAFWLTLVHRETGEEIDTLYTTSYGAYQEGGMTIHNDYEESVFRVSREEIGDYVLRYRGWYYTSALSGEWTVGFTIPQQMKSVEIPAGRSVEDSGGEVWIREMSLSPLSLTMAVERQPAEEWTVEIVDRNGSAVEAAMFSYGDGILRYTGPFPGFESVSAVTVNGVRFGLEP